jgi:hypothetical protein
LEVSTEFCEVEFPEISVSSPCFAEASAISSVFLFVCEVVFVLFNELLLSVTEFIPEVILLERVVKVDCFRANEAESASI